MGQLEDFAAENGVGAGPLKNVFKSLLSIPNSEQCVDIPLIYAKC